MQKLIENFKKEEGMTRVGLIAAAVAFLSTFAPWVSVRITTSYGNFGGSASGWHSYGFLTVLGSLAFVGLWVLLQLKPEVKLPWKELIIRRVAAAAMLVGSILWCVSADFAFDFLGWGWYVGLIASSTALYYGWSEKQ